MDLMGYAFEWILNVNVSLTAVSKPRYSCDYFTRNDYNLTLRDIVMGVNLHEYGNYYEQSANQFFQVKGRKGSNGNGFQDVEARIFRIDRSVEYEDAFYNKELGYWKVTNKLTTLYGSLDVNVRLLDIYRVVTLIVSELLIGSYCFSATPFCAVHKQPRSSLRRILHRLDEYDSCRA